LSGLRVESVDYLPAVTTRGAPANFSAFNDRYLMSTLGQMQRSGQTTEARTDNSNVYINSASDSGALG